LPCHRLAQQCSTHARGREYARRAAIPVRSDQSVLPKTILQCHAAAQNSLKPRRPRQSHATRIDLVPLALPPLPRSLCRHRGCRYRPGLASGGGSIERTCSACGTFRWDWYVVDHIGLALLALNDGRSNLWGLSTGVSLGRTFLFSGVRLAFLAS
jgi:hypothetical protein